MNVLQHVNGFTTMNYYAGWVRNKLNHFWNFVTRVPTWWSAKVIYTRISNWSVLYRE